MKCVCVPYGSIVFIYKNRKRVCFYDNWVWTVTLAGTATVLDEP